MKVKTGDVAADEYSHVFVMQNSFTLWPRNGNAYYMVMVGLILHYSGILPSPSLIATFDRLSKVM